MTVTRPRSSARPALRRPAVGYASPTLADIVIATLKASGVRRIYGLPGDSLNGLTDALHRDGDVTWHTSGTRSRPRCGGRRGRDHRRAGRVRSELRTGEPAPDQRPFDAQRSRVPVLAIAAHIPLHRHRKRVLPGDASAAFDRRAHGDLEHARQLFRDADQLGVDAALAEQLLRVGLLEVPGADLRPRDVRGERQRPEPGCAGRRTGR